MTTKVNTKVRLVRCPKCRQVLAELPEVLLYKCGGCGTILEAKNRKADNSQTELSSQEKGSVAKNHQDNVLEEKEEARSPNHHFIGPPTVPSSPDKYKGCHDEHGDCGMEHCEDKSVREGTSGSPEVTSHQKEDSPIEGAESLKCDNQLGQNSDGYHSKFHDDDGGRNSSSEFSSSGQFSHDAEVYNSEAGEDVERDDRVDKMECGESKRVWQEEDYSDEVQNLPEHENEESILPPDGEQRDGIRNNYVRPENDEKSQVSFTDQNGDFDGGNKGAGLDSSSGIVSHENENISKSAEQSTEVDDGADGLPTFTSSSTERNMDASVIDSTDAPQSPMNESHVSFYLTSPDDDHLDHSLREGTRNFERVSSVDTLGSSSLADLSSELNSKHPSMMNYPTTRSYDAYDGSESSCDGADDRIREHISRPLRKSMDVDYISTTEMLRKDGFGANNVVSSESERIYWATSSSHHATRSSNLSHDESTETNRYTSRNRMRLDKQGAGSRVPFTSRDPLPGNGTLGISSYRHDLLPPRPGFNSSHKPSYSEADNMDLLRTVWELKDQLNRMQFPKVTTNRRFPTGAVNGKFTPYHYDHLAMKREMFEDHPAGYNPRFNQARGYAGQFNISRLAFSGEAAHHRHQLSCSCLHCCPQDWHYSAQLPSCSVHHENGHCLVHNDHNCCNIASSLSPQHYTSSELSLWGCETKSDNQRPDELKRLCLKEKYHTAKRHLRPVAGGAPVIGCYHCSEVLQLPADFLLFKKRYHQLMCNACKKVLKFSVLEGTHIVPYLPDASAPPPSEVGDYNDATSGRNLDPLTHSSSRKNAEPVSCSDDYGPSFRGSWSTEGEDSVILPSFAHAKRNRYNRKVSSGSSYEPMEDRKKKSILREPQNKNENLLKNVESVGDSSEMPKWRKATSEIEELPASANSPLHRLMGYSSPSQVLNK